MLAVNVSLPSGKRKTLSLEQCATVGDLQVLAQKSFGQGFLRLVTEEGRMLTDLMETLPSAIHDGEHLTAIAQQPKLAASCYAFAMWCCGGDRVVTWGDQNSGGDSSAVRGQLRNVQKIEATSGAFAAILADGSVLTWGEQNTGGDSSAVQDQLRNVQLIHSTRHFSGGSSGAFVAVLRDGSIVSWGDPQKGKVTSAVADQIVYL